MFTRGRGSITSCEVSGGGGVNGCNGRERTVSYWAMCEGWTEAFR